MRLSTKVHDRDAAGLTYVYPVVSRRAQGVSVGINLNPNNACNWRCVYCQVPDLKYGKGPAIDVDLLEQELERMLTAILRGDYMERCVPEGSRRLNDVALSGNGEPTSSPEFERVLERVARVMGRHELAGSTPLVVITNGSLIHTRPVRRGLEHLAALGAGEVWYKLDSATPEGQRRLNGGRAGTERALSNLRLAADTCATWIQTCLFTWNGEPPSAHEQEAYVAALAELWAAPPAHLRGVLLYGLARPSHQPEAPTLGPLSSTWLEAFAERLRAVGAAVRVHA